MDFETLSRMLPQAKEFVVSSQSAKCSSFGCCLTSTFRLRWRTGYVGVQRGFLFCRLMNGNKAAF
jgi:hypothetical protein